MAALRTFTLLLGSAIQVITGLVNVALNKPASMSSRYNSGGLPAGGAVDGNISAVWPNIIHTDIGRNFAWWMVDLLGEVQDGTVNIYFRTQYTRRRNGTELYTSVLPFSSYPGGQLCHIFNGSNIPDVGSTICPGKWRFLLVYTNTWDDGGAVLHFGEVVILGCLGDIYGPQCSMNCEYRHCKDSNSTCNPVNGRCHGGCLPGWKEIDCMQECPHGSYGPGCQSLCRQCVGNMSCDHVTGNCDDGYEEKSELVPCSQSPNGMQ